ncbi:MAG: transglycosylase SLT domain-containing protein [Nitrospira sp.]|nr:transglycosylase SLT domain-containing protein [Nitrospira sp.]
MMTMCVRLRGTQATIAAVLSATLLLPAFEARAQSNSAGDQGSPVGEQGNPAGEIESPQEDDGIDSNLVPLEPELTVSPPDLPSADGIAEQPDETPGKAALDTPDATSVDTQGPVYNIPVVIDQTVQSHIHFFNTSIRNRFEQWLLRFSRYRPLVENIFAEFDLPSDLVNLSLVESGFNPYAYSRAKATGPWQFMKGTGQLYGLRIDHYVDERRDPIKSTVAAARYLRDLYDLFGAWPLAMAAYNAGEGKVLRALQKAQAESFSEISKTKLIRRETKQYVPRIMAATIIAKNPDQYGFNQDPVPLHQFEEVMVTRPLHFRAIANVTGIPYAELRLLNPELRRDATPPDDSAYHLKVPVGTSAKVVELIDRVPTHKFPPLHVSSQRVKTDAARRYRVRMGDTLEKVSRRFHIPLKTLKALNNLSNPAIKAGEFLVITR